VYRKWKVLLNDSGLGPAPDREDFPKLINYTYEWLKSRDYEELLPYGGFFFFFLFLFPFDYLINSFFLNQN